MEQKYNESTPQRPEGARVVDDKVVAINVPSFLNTLKEESTWADSDRNAITVFKTNGLRVVLIGLHNGAEMSPYTANGIVSVQVLEGKISVLTDVRNMSLEIGHMAVLHKNVSHSIKAEVDSFFLLTLSTNQEAENEAGEETSAHDMLYWGL